MKTPQIFRHFEVQILAFELYETDPYLFYFFVKSGVNSYPVSHLTCVLVIIRSGLSPWVWTSIIGSATRGCIVGPTSGSNTVLNYSGSKP